MFRKVLIFAMFATAAGYCFAAQNLPQVVTSEVFYSQEKDIVDNETEQVQYQQQEFQTVNPAPIPAWPIAGSDADMDVVCDSNSCAKNKQSDNIKIVSKIGADLVVENNFNLGAGRSNNFGGWSGGANLLHGTQIPVGFDDECNNGAEMPLLHREVLEDDGGNVLTVSRSGRKNCGGYADGYLAFATKNGMVVRADGKVINEKGEIVDETGMMIRADGKVMNERGEIVDENGVVIDETTEIAVDVSADAEAPAKITDQVRSWVVANGQTLREVLQNWCNKEGWDLVWATSREYPIEASAVFKGRFVDVASALVRNFGRATPIPYAKFYKGNRVLVISTNEE